MCAENPCLVVPFSVNSLKKMEIESPLMPDSREDMREPRMVVLDDSTVEAALEEVSQLHLSTLLAERNEEEQAEMREEECMA